VEPWVVVSPTLDPTTGLTATRALIASIRWVLALRLNLREGAASDYSRADIGVSDRAFGHDLVMMPAASTRLLLIILIGRELWFSTIATELLSV
jgi:hypothetical protein